MLIYPTCSCAGQKLSISKWVEHIEEQHTILRTDGREFRLEKAEIQHFGIAVTDTSCLIPGSQCKFSDEWLSAIHKGPTRDLYQGFELPYDFYIPSEFYGKHHGMLILLKNQRGHADDALEIPHDFPPLLIRCFNKLRIGELLDLPHGVKRNSISFEFTAKLLCSNEQRRCIESLPASDIPYLNVRLLLGKLDHYLTEQCKTALHIRFSDCDGKKSFRLHNWENYMLFKERMLDFSFGRYDDFCY